jgi:hypothetical protein
MSTEFPLFCPKNATWRLLQLQVVEVNNPGSSKHQTGPLNIGWSTSALGRIPAQVSPRPDSEKHHKRTKKMQTTPAKSKKAARRRLFNSNLTLVDQAAINPVFNFRR